MVHPTNIYVSLQLNQSPFNVGLPIQLIHFNLHQVHQYTYRVNSYLNHQSLMSIDFNITGNYKPPQHYSNFTQLQPVMNRISVMKTLFGWGPYSCSSLTFDFEVAKIRPIEGTLKILNAYIPGLKVRQYPVLGIDREKLGVFQMNSPWSLTLPYTCQNS